MKSIKLSDYFEFVNPKYIYLRIIPHKSIRNYNSSNIAKAIANTYRGINKRIRREQKKLFFETNFKISYVIDIEHNNASFYFVVPRPFKNIIIEKIKEIWAKATIEETEPIKNISKEADVYELSYKKDDALSLQVDKKSNEPLNSILSVIDIMKEDDRITILYNFIPRSQFGWIEKYEETMQKIKEKRNIDKDTTSISYILKSGLLGTLSCIDAILDVINDFLGGKRDTKDTLYNQISNLLEKQKELSPATKKKKELQVINAEIIVASESEDATRRNNNSLAVCQSYRTLDGDNELIYKKINKKVSIENYSICSKINTISTDECQNFIQIPGRLLLAQYGLRHIKTEETQVPEKLRKGFFTLGTNTYKGVETEAYIEDEYNQGNLPLTLIGSQGSGKTTYIKNIVKNCTNNNESVFVLDFIKNCELSEDIIKIVDKEKLVVIDLSKEKDIQGLGYNEIKIDANMTAYEKLSLASIQSQQIMSLVDSISVGDPLSSRMRRYLNAAANVTFCLGYSSVKDVISCLENYSLRKKYIASLSSDLKEFLEDEINTLYELDEYSKATKDNPNVEVIGTKDSKIEHILDRVSMLREDFKLKYMYNKSTKDNINLVDLLDKGKVIIIKMPENEFPTKMIKNILITYWISKVWLSSQIRGSKTDKPSRVNTIIDEVFQAPTSLSLLEYILPQSRKFGTKFIFSTQYIKQLDSIFESLEASGGSFMLLTGSNEDDFNHFKSKIDNYEYEDLRDMDRFSSLNLIKYSDGYSSFITKLPRFIS